MDSAIPIPMATLTQTPLQAATLGDSPSIPHVTHPLLQPTVLKTLETASVYMFPPRVIPATLSDKLLPLQEKMNAALEQLLTVRSSRNLHCKELDLNMELAAHLNEVQTTEAIRQANVHGATAAYAPQQAHKESALVLEHQAMEEERWTSQAFMEAFGVAMGSCLPENWGAHLYPLQVLTGDIPLAALQGMSATAQLWAMADRKLAPTAPIPRVPEMPAPPTGTECQCYSSGP